MIVTSKIKLDMAQPGTANPVFVVQGDGNTRAVDADLLANGSSWAPDDGWEAAITYRKPDGTKGLYNLLDDGSSAINISGSTATVILAQQMMTVPGAVRAAIVFNNQRLDQLTSFPFLVSVARNQFAGAQQSEDYIRLQWLEDKLDEYLRKAADSGAFDGAPGADGHTPVYGVDYGTPEQIAGIANHAAEILQTEVNQIKDDLADIKNATDNPVSAGKVWTATKDGAIWADIQGGGEFVKLNDIVIREDVSSVDLTSSDSGSAYNVTCFEVEFYIPAGSANGGIRIDALAKGGNRTVIDGAAMKTSQTVSQFLFGQVSGIPICTVIINRALDHFDTSQYAGIDLINSENPYQEILIRATTTGCKIPAGSRIVVRGV